MSFKYLYFSLCHKVWRKTSIYLPLWRQEMQRKSNELQEELNKIHELRNFINDPDGNKTTLEAIQRNSCVVNYELIEKIREVRKN